MSTLVGPPRPSTSATPAAEGVLHDIRGSLTIIRGHCHSVVRDGRATARTIARLRRIDREVERIADAVEMVRDLVRGASGHDAPFVPVDLGPLVAAAVERVEGVARSRQVAVAHAVRPDGLVAAGSVQMLDRVLDNILLNAISASRAGGIVEVELVSSGHAAGIVVRNEVGDRPDRHDGWGLGLRIVRDIVGRHGGVVHLARDGDRASVRLSLPLRTDGVDR